MSHTPTGSYTRVGVCPMATAHVANPKRPCENLKLGIKILDKQKIILLECIIVGWVPAKSQPGSCNQFKFENIETKIGNYLMAHRALARPCRVEVNVVRTASKVRIV